MIFWGKKTNYIMKMRLYCSQGTDGWQICDYFIESWEQFHFNGIMDFICKQESRNVANVWCPSKWMIFFIHPRNINNFIMQIENIEK